jgi:hypothetical protein
VLGVGLRTLKSVIEIFRESGTVEAHTRQSREGLELERRLGSKLHQGHLDLMKRVIDDSAKLGQVIACSRLQHEIATLYGHTLDVRTVRRGLRMMGYSYRRGKIAPLDTSSPEATARMRKFLIEYAEARKLQDGGEALIVYMDESYINAGHARQYGWFRKGQPLNRPFGRGARLIIIHAFTKHGLLHDGETTDLTLVPKHSETAHFSCEMIFKASIEDGDYHKNMDARTYEYWLKYRLFCTFRKLFPGLRLFLVQDNAKYHKARPHGVFTRRGLHNQANKTQLAALLHKYDVSEVKAIRDGGIMVFEEDKWLCRAPNGPSKTELAQAAESVYDAHPELEVLNIEKIFKEESEKDGLEHKVIWTPPYRPEIQPAELVWCYVKNHVAWLYTKGRSLKDLRAVTVDAFYGDEANDHKPVDELIPSLIDRAEKEMNACIAADSQLGGDISNLLYEEADLDRPFIITLSDSDSESESDDGLFPDVLVQDEEDEDAVQEEDVADPELDAVSNRLSSEYQANLARNIAAEKKAKRAARVRGRTAPQRSRSVLGHLPVNRPAQSVEQPAALTMQVEQSVAEEYHRVYWQVLIEQLALRQAL